MYIIYCVSHTSKIILQECYCYWILLLNAASMKYWPRYTGDIHNSSVVGLFMTPIGQWKRLYRVMVECTCLLHIGPLSPSNFITSICSGLVVRVVSASLRASWQDFTWHDASRGPSAIAELRVDMCERTDRQTDTLIAIDNIRLAGGGRAGNDRIAWWMCRVGLESAVVPLAGKLVERLRTHFNRDWFDRATSVCPSVRVRFQIGRRDAALIANSIESPASCSAPSQPFESLLVGGVA